jgi:hypothetical protein
MEEKLKFPTEQIELPSKGLPYPAESLLSKGVLEMKYMSAKEEDILTNVNFLKNGTVIDKLLQSMIVTSIDYDDLLICDKNALLVAARILGYGKDYEFEYDGQKINFDLSSVDPLPLNENIKPGRNEFDFHLPKANVTVTFKLLTHGDEKKIDREIQGLKKINPQGSFDQTTRLKHTIIAINGDRDTTNIREFVDNMLISDLRELRKYIIKITPELSLKFDYTKDNGDVVEGVNLPIGISFLWPDSSL